jgi:hypothetical protein
MVRRTDRPLLQVRVSFETTRFSQQHLIEIYGRLVPTLRRRNQRPASDGAPQPKTQATAGSGGRP